MSCNFRDLTELIILFKVSTIVKNVAKAINRFFEHRINFPPKISATNFVKTLLRRKVNGMKEIQ